MSDCEGKRPDDQGNKPSMELLLEALDWLKERGKPRDMYSIQSEDVDSSQTRTLAKKK